MTDHTGCSRAELLNAALRLKAMCEGGPAYDYVADAKLCNEGLIELLRRIEELEKANESWAEHVKSFRCRKCKHEPGPIGTPKDIEKDYKLVWQCPCECHGTIQDSTRQRDAAVQAEREACAKIADDNSIHPVWLGDPELGLTDNARVIAAAIRSRGPARESEGNDNG